VEIIFLEFKGQVPHSSPNVILMIKSRRVRWAGHIVRMGRRGMHTGFCCENQKEISH
jgi:hypothetical protein